MTPAGSSDNPPKVRLRYPRFQHLEPTMMVVMVAGIVALCQPWNLFLHRYGLTIIILGLIGFIIVSHMGPGAAQTQDEEE